MAVAEFNRFAKFVLIVDTEGQVRPREIAGILFDIDEDQILQECTTLIPHQMTDRMRFKTGVGSVDYQRRCNASKNITRAMLDQSLGMFNQMIDQCDVVFAHGAHHDKAVFAGLPRIDFQDKPWFCTIRFPWPGTFSRRLINVASNVDVKVTKPHVALADCHMLLECLRKHRDFKTVVRQFPRSMRCMDDMQADIQTDDERPESPVILGKRKRPVVVEIESETEEDGQKGEFDEPEEFLLSMLDACKSVDGGK